MALTEQEKLLLNSKINGTGPVPDKTTLALAQQLANIPGEKSMVIDQIAAIMNRGYQALLGLQATNNSNNDNVGL